MPSETMHKAGRDETMADPSVGFADLGLSDQLLRAVEALGFETPTKVQVDLIPIALTGKDILGQSRTGTGKTAAFGLPLLQQISGDGRCGRFKIAMRCIARWRSIRSATRSRSWTRISSAS